MTMCARSMFRARLRSCRVLAVAVVVASTWVPALAFADTVADAKDLFARGRELRVQGDCASAVPLFRKAYELYPAGLGSLRNLAECEEQLGQFASARRGWLDLKRLLVTNSEPKYEGWTQDAEQAAARLEPKVARLTIDVAVVGTHGETVSSDSVEVMVNGERLPPTVIGTPLERDPGRYVVRVAGFRISAPSEHVVELAAGDNQRVGLRAVATPEINTDRDTSAATKRTAAWVSIGVGAAGVVGMGVSLLVYKLALDDVNQCPKIDGKPHCIDSPALRATADRGATASTLVNVFAVVGAVGLATGFVLLATSPSRPTRAAVLLSPGGVSAVGRF
jgi:hypothetical protein